jgi:HSP20 family protein
MSAPANKRAPTALRTTTPTPLTEYLDQVFDNLRQEMLTVGLPGSSLWESGFSNGLVLAPTDIEDRPSSYLVRANLPGLRKENVEVQVQGHTLRIEGKEAEEKEEKSRSYLRRERTYRGFVRTFDLPEDVVADKISAKYQDGVLSIEIPKAHPEPSKRIPVG